MLVFQPAEETAEGARAMVNDKRFAQFLKADVANNILST
jgi:metal-dependent amidase/aminoacylase/carboxypeptidase family protein